MTMQHAFMGPFWGNIVIIVLAGAITLGCFAAMFRMLFHPGEGDPRHPKYMILREERPKPHPEGG